MINLASIVTLFHPNHQQAMTDAINHAAKLAGDKHEQRAKVNHWTDVIHGINPHTHWHEFAYAKQKQHDAIIELNRVEAMEQRAQQEARNYINQYGDHGNEAI